MLLGYEGEEGNELATEGSQGLYIRGHPKNNNQGNKATSPAVA